MIGSLALLTKKPRLAQRFLSNCTFYSDRSSGSIIATSYFSKAVLYCYRASSVDLNCVSVDVHGTALKWVYCSHNRRVTSFSLFNSNCHILAFPWSCSRSSRHQKFQNRARYIRGPESDLKESFVHVFVQRTVVRCGADCNQHQRHLNVEEKAFSLFRLFVNQATKGVTWED